MKVIRAATIDEAVLISSSVPETPPAAYNSATNYGLDARVSIFAGTAATIYESLQANNLGNAPATSPTWWRAIATTFAVYDPGATYALGDIVIHPASHRTFESQQAANTGHPLTDPAWWLDSGPTNRWAMFDAYNQTQTERTGSIDVTLKPVGLINAVALLNLEASSVTVTVRDAVAGEVYNQTFNLISASNVGADFYAWAFEPIIRRSDLHVEGLPAYLNPTISLSIGFSEGSTARCGNVALGLQRELGVTVMGAGFGIIDHSRKNVDDFGNIDLVVRSYRKVGTFDVVIEREMVDEVGRLLTLYRATPIVYIGSGDYASTIYYGFFRDFRMIIEHSTHSKMTIEIEGLS